MTLGKNADTCVFCVPTHAHKTQTHITLERDFSKTKNADEKARVPRTVFGLSICLFFLWFLSKLTKPLEMVGGDDPASSYLGQDMVSF